MRLPLMPRQAHTAMPAAPWARSQRGRACSELVELPRPPACDDEMHRSMRTVTEALRRALSARARNAEQRTRWEGRGIAL